jgi:hypothetical protein
LLFGLRACVGGISEGQSEIAIAQVDRDRVKVVASGSGSLDRATHFSRFKSRGATLACKLFWCLLAHGFLPLKKLRDRAMIRIAAPQLWSSRKKRTFQSLLTTLLASIAFTRLPILA